MESQTRRLARHVRHTTSRLVPSDQTDAELLARYVDHRDEAAFAALVRRHGPMVLGVCRRLLPNRHDAEDAFQAAFLVLVRRAGDVRPREMVGNWLHGVARQTALKARATFARRRETLTPEPPERAPRSPDLWDDSGAVLDAELKGLPEKYRVTILLCDLQGQTHAAAARQLGWPVGTLAGRLSRARALLAKRLARRGLTLSTLALTAAVSSTLLRSTVQAATGAGPAAPHVAALAKGVVQVMVFTKVKRALVVLVCVAALGLAARTWVLTAHGQSGGEPTPAAQAATPAERLDASRREAAKLQGTWKMVALEKDGIRYGEGRPEVKGGQVIIKDDLLELTSGDGLQTLGITFQPDPSRTPKVLGMRALGKSLPSIYQVEGDTLLICWAEGKPDELPPGFTANYGQKWALMTFRRDRAEPIPVPKPPEASASKDLPKATTNNKVGEEGPLTLVHHVHSQQVTVEFNITQVGPSGVGEVQVYITQDDGRSWAAWSKVKDADPKPPADAPRRALVVELPGEGTYGLYLVVKSGAGLGQPPPEPGTPPQVRFEVDLKTPEAALFQPKPEAGRTDTLVFTWEARDRNLTDKPVQLEWAENQDGPWLPISGELANVPSRFAWKMPPKLPAQVHLRLTVRDRAGNSCVAQTDKPFPIDFNVPKVDDAIIVRPGPR